MKKIYPFISEYVQIALAILFTSIGLKAFLLPNGFLDGGVTGIAILIREFVPIEISYILPVVSLPFFILGDTVNYMLIQGVSHDSQYGRPSLSLASMENRMSNFTRSATPL
jgi:hypothetical protein